MARVVRQCLLFCFHVDRGHRPGEEGRGVVTYVFWGLFTCTDSIVQARIVEDRLILQFKRVASA